MLESASVSPSHAQSVDPHSHAFAPEAALRDDELELPFVRACKPREAFRVGAEAEKFGVDAKTGAPLRYAGDHGVERILRTLIEKHGWAEEGEYAGGPLIALRRGDASVTLEPGSQLELSGAPLPDAHAIARELVSHMSELAEVSRELGIVWLGVGYHPFARQEDLDWVPKARYAIMREYLPTRGGRALDMMRRTSTVQANLDYSSERDAMRKMRVTSKLAPVTTALFANSPFVEGALTADLSQRARVWLDVDPDRTGLVPQLWREGAGFRDYVEWALDAPLFMIKRDGKAVDNRGQPFRDFLKNGFQGHRATMSDWETHLNTLFPEVRLKRTIEIRGADSLPAPYFAALPALFMGLLYDDAALDEAEALVEPFGHDELAELRTRIPSQALRAQFRGRPLAELAQQVLDIASRGLERRAIFHDGQDERVHLAPIVALAAQAKCPADALREAVASSSDLRAAILERATV